MNKIISILTLTLLLNASEDTCYSVQLASVYNSPNNSQMITNGTYPEDCRLLEVGDYISLRCGCFDKYSKANASMEGFKKKYPNAFIRPTYKSAFAVKNQKIVKIKDIKKSAPQAKVVDKRTTTPKSVAKDVPIVEVVAADKRLVDAPMKKAKVVKKQPVKKPTPLPPVQKKRDVKLPSTKAITLTQAIEKLKANNLEIQGATYDISAAKADEDTASGSNWGKLDFIQDVARSNDAGNVFGFKLSSREANFGDFGLSEFSLTNPNILSVQPDDLNYPDDRNYFQSKIKYELPLFTGFQISSYSEIMASMTRMKTLEKKQLINEKIYELRKSFYDVALIKNSTKNLELILKNILKLEDTTDNMISVGYAKNVDLLEVKAKKGNVERLLMQMHSNEKLLYHYISFLLNEKVTQITTPNTDVPMPTMSTQEILKNNVDIQKATTGLALRKSMVGVSQASYYPMVGAFGEFSTADDSFLGDAGDHKAYTVGARLTWNIFNGGIDSAKVEKSQLEHLKMKTQVQLAKAGIELQVQKIKTEIASFDEEVASLEKELALANEIYTNYEGRYKEKLTSMSNVIIKQSEQIEKILQLQQVKNKRNERIFALEKIANGDIYDK
jgi:outer membrane protein